MDTRIKRFILALLVTALMLGSPYLPFLGFIGIIFALFLYLVEKSKYFAIGVGILSLLYETGYVPVSAFIGPMMMIIWGEYFLKIFKNAGHPTTIYMIGSTLALLATMLYTNEFEPLVGIIAVIVLLMLRSILTNREDGSMIGLLGVGMTITLFEDLQFFVDYQTLSLAVIICAAFGYFAYRAKTIDLSGVFTAVLFGVILISFAGVNWFFVVMMFFILGSIFTKFRYSEKEFLGVAQSKHGRRGYLNAFANAGVGIVGAVLYGLTGDVIFIALFLGSISTATADTLASEIGVTGGKPYLITTLRQVQPGTNGGITVLGELACLGGAVIISGLAFVLGVAPWYVCLIGVITGFIGTNLDSLYGALLENKKIIGNSGTNLLATLSGGIIAMLICMALIHFGIV
ncbi:MAG TPA: TIGR00297 family protein [Methanocorpusculum sp.]|nr:TIGR00297 family protein [Methanocorpusculum sp.]